ncbi:MAG TPA: hypothetical protein VFF52_03810 [Isosphaeraceae bacterium]|nr:hypothetical protein [Isosphaeraceae bacterium]
MPPTNDSHPARAPAGEACLVRTRLAVLNVLVGVGLTIALGGWLLRGRAEGHRPAPPGGVSDLLLPALLALIVASCILRSVLARRAPDGPPARRASAFYWAHVLPAAVIALAAPLGIAYGWWVNPRVNQGVLMFWIIPLALGFLFLPRSYELDAFHDPAQDPSRTPSP